MKFSYAYRDSANARHDGVISASSKDAAFRALKAQGVKPFFVAPAPGLLNRLAGLGARGAAILLLLLALGATLVWAFRGKQGENAYFDSTTRRYPIGDPALIAEGIRTGWADVFAEEGERFLASYAIPGVTPAVRSADEKQILAALARKVGRTPEDSIEVRQIKAMVEGVKGELRDYLSDGGSVPSFRERLRMRQAEEIQYYRQAKAEIDRAIEAKMDEREIEVLTARHNANLRRMGICPVVRTSQTPRP